MRELRHWPGDPPSEHAVTGTFSLVSLSHHDGLPTPQFGWQPQLQLAPVGLRAVNEIAQSLKVDMKEIGNQSRAGTPVGLVLNVVRQWLSV